MQHRNLHGKNTASCYKYSKITPKRIREWVTDHRLGYMIGTQQDSSPTWRNVYYCKDRAVRWCFDRKDTNRRKLLSSVVGILEAARIQRQSACGIRGRMNTSLDHCKQVFILLRILIPWISFQSNGATRCSKYWSIDAVSSKSTYRTSRFGFCHVGA